MTRVTDDDLEWLAGYCDGDSAKAARIVREMRIDLLALRKVADAAMKARAAGDLDPSYNSYDNAILDALAKAGL